jgi:ubiquinone/menaquinone biosynthesis C-methylase UbiE
LNSSAPDEGDQLSHVDRRFAATAQWWDKAYDGGEVLGTVLRGRSNLALGWTQRLGLPPRTKVLDVGCGAGQMTIALARNGLQVSAIDRVPLMIDLTRAKAEDHMVASLVSAHVGDAHRLDFESSSFQLAIALGLIDWVQSPHEAIVELARVIEPGGWLILSCAHSRALVYLLDPLNNPYLKVPRASVKATLGILGFRRYRVPSQRPFMLKRRELDSLLESNGFEKIDGRTIGFGPFSIFGRHVMPNSLGSWVNERLQSLADKGTPVFRSAGMGYMVLARKKPGSGALEEPLSASSRRRRIRNRWTPPTAR